MSSDYQYICVNDYILKDNIGEGNFGKVKLGINKYTGEEFAVKIINKEQIKIKMKNKIFKENDIIIKFNHINVIFVYEIIEDINDYYIITEYCKNGELFDYIVKKEKLSEEEASIFFYQLINGVEHIHSKKIAHRDLKPENLLLTKDNTLKIIDFGLSHEFDGTKLLKTKCGSPSYAAPEILKGKPYNGFKSDIWCCGIILYAMVCGYLPFDGDTNKILFKNILKCQPEIPDYLSESVKNLICNILNSDPDERLCIDDIKKHSFYLKGKKLCKIDYRLIEKNVLKNRKNKSSFRLNDDENFPGFENYDDKEKNKNINDFKGMADIMDIINKAEKKEKNEKFDKIENKRNSKSCIKTKENKNNNNCNLKSIREKIVNMDVNESSLKNHQSFKRFNNILNYEYNNNKNNNIKDKTQVINLTRGKNNKLHNNVYKILMSNMNKNNRFNKFLKIGIRNLHINLNGYEKKYLAQKNLDIDNKSDPPIIINNKNLCKNNNFISFLGKFKGNYEKTNSLPNKNTDKENNNITTTTNNYPSPNIVSGINSINSNSTEENDLKNIIKLNNYNKIKKNIPLDNISIKSNRKIKIIDNNNEQPSHLFCNNINININNYNIKTENSNNYLPKKNYLSTSKIPDINTPISNKANKFGYKSSKEKNSSIKNSSKKSSTGYVKYIHTNIYNNINHKSERKNIAKKNSKVMLKTKINDILNKDLSFKEKKSNQAKTQTNFYKINKNLDNMSYRKTYIQNKKKNNMLQYIKNEISNFEKNGGSEGKKSKCFSDAKDILKAMKNKEKSTWINKKKKNIYLCGAFNINVNNNNHKTFINDKKLLPMVHD